MHNTLCRREKSIPSLLRISCRKPGIFCAIEISFNGTRCWGNGDFIIGLGRTHNVNLCLTSDPFDEILCVGKDTRQRPPARSRLPPADGGLAHLLFPFDECLDLPESRVTIPAVCRCLNIKTPAFRTPLLVRRFFRDFCFFSRRFRCSCSDFPIHLFAFRVF